MQTLKKIFEALYKLATFGTTERMPRFIEVGYSFMFWFNIGQLVTVIILQLTNSN